MGNTDQSVYEKYDTAVPPTNTNVSSPNEIVELDAHARDTSNMPDQYNAPSLHDTTLGALADMLAELGANELSAKMEIERRALVDNSDHIPRFTASRLTEIARILVIVDTVATYEQNHDKIDAIQEFGKLIDKSHSAPMDGTQDTADFPSIEPQNGDYIDPFSVIQGRQFVYFVDDDGEQIYPDDFEEAADLLYPN